MIAEYPHRPFPLISIFIVVSLVAVVITPSAHLALSQTGESTGHSNTQAQASATPKTESPLKLTATVTDESGHFITGLTSTKFSVYVDKRPQRIVSLSQAEGPVSIGFLLDTSASISTFYQKGGKINRSAVDIALSGFIQLSNPSNEYFIITFNRSPQLLVDATRDHKAVVAAIGRLSVKSVKGRTAFYDACHAGIQKMSTATYPRRVLIVISDGQDTYSYFTLDKLRRQLKESDILLYAVGILTPNVLAAQSALRGETILRELTSITGGKGYFTSHTSKLFEKLVPIMLELKSQYTLNVMVSDDGTGLWRKLELNASPLRNPSGEQIKLYPRTRQGYYSPVRPPTAATN